MILCSTFQEELKRPYIVSFFYGPDVWEVFDNAVH